MDKHCLVIGFGSIGVRHAKVLEELGFHVHVVSKRNIRGYKAFKEIKQALVVSNYHYAVICRPTSDHYPTVLKLKKYGFNGFLLIEKPLFEKVRNPSLDSMKIFVGYNLRFHPILKEIHRLIKGVRLYSMHVYCGQYLPQWREGRDYQTTYSASEELGGGVLRDLSHEFDYICWLTGGWEKIAAQGGRVSNLKIDTDDVFGILLKTKNCPIVSLQVNYLDLTPKREIILNGEDLSLKADIINGVLEINGKKTIFQTQRNDTYLEQDKDILLNGSKFACTYEQGLEIMDLIEAVQKASKEDIWVKRI